MGSNPITQTKENMLKFIKRLFNKESSFNNLPTESQGNLALLRRNLKEAEAKYEEIRLGLFKSEESLSPMEYTILTNALNEAYDNVKSTKFKLHDAQRALINK